jgi:hypothetical protein
VKGVLVVMFFIEEASCIKVGGSEMLSDNLDSIERIASFSQERIFDVN